MKYSILNEENIIKKYLTQLKIDKGICIDIGASNGTCSSNTLAFYEDGWSGLAIECTTAKFADLANAYRDLPQVVLCRHKVSPYNINGIVSTFCGYIDFLSIDIDGYDYFVLDALLEKFRPKLICTEINENIPPPVKFTVKYDPDHFWSAGVTGMLFGYSISQLDILCKRYNYCIAEQEYNNVFLIPAEICPVKAITPEESWYEGYYNRPDKKEKLNNNWAIIEKVLALPGQKKVDYLNEILIKQKGKFICSL